MSAETTLLVADEDRRAGGAGGLLVCWQHPRSRAYSAVAELTATGNVFEFSYLARARHVEGFRPLLAFPDLCRRYVSESLFPLFAQRLMDQDRPDRPAWLGALDLPIAAEPMEILARSGGHRSGDTLELLPHPAVRPDGATVCRFLVHGISHVDGAADRIPALLPGQRLSLERDVTNAHNPRALLVTAESRTALGWVPDPLVDYVATVLESGPSSLRVVRTNPPEWGPHLRLMVELDGVWRGPSPFSGPDWQRLDC